jgi:hypothetical protein
MPMQKIETVDRSPRSEALASGQTTLGSYRQPCGRISGTGSSGGTTAGSTSLLKEFQGNIYLIQILNAKNNNMFRKK